MKYSPIRSGHAPSPRQLQVEDCLLENMRQTPYEAISISDLCRQVGVSRRAFYLYFKDKDQCLFSLIERKYRDLLLWSATQLPVDASPLEICQATLTIFKEKRSFFDLMIRNRLFDTLVGRIVHYAEFVGDCFLPTRQLSSSQIDPDLQACLITSQLALLLRWHNCGYETPVEEMAGKLLKLTAIVHPGIDPNAL